MTSQKTPVVDRSICLLRPLKLTHLGNSSDRCKQQDEDFRCVHMTVLNMALFNRYSYVIWGNSLSLEKRLVYRTGFDGNGGGLNLAVALYQLV